MISLKDWLKLTDKKRLAYEIKLYENLDRDTKIKKIFVVGIVIATAYLAYLYITLFW